jgi:hypothetical protein
MRIKRKKIVIPEEEYKRIFYILGRDLNRYPDIESFNENDVRKLVDHLDGILVRWIRTFSRSLGIEVIHQPTESYPIKFEILPLIKKKISVKNLSKFCLSPHQLKELFLEKGQENITYHFLNSRLKELEESLPFKFNIQTNVKKHCEGKKAESFVENKIPLSRFTPEAFKDFIESSKERGRGGALFSDVDASDLYKRAIRYSLRGNRTYALETLSRALELKPEYKEDAKKEKKFKNFWNDEDFKRIVS